MRALTAAALLDVWERGRHAHPLDRALMLLGAACPEVDAAALAALSVGDRDARLFALRGACFGDRLQARTSCPACAAAVEVELSCGAAAGAAGDRSTREASIPLTLDVDGCALRLRPLDSLDLAAVAACPSVEAARRALVSRAIQQATRDGEAVAIESLSDDIVSAASQALSARDPLAEVRLDLHCPSCATRWQADLDIADLLWTEIEARARRLLYDVHRLAREYGWTEREILALSPLRREAYLQMVPA